MYIVCPLSSAVHLLHYTSIAVQAAAKKGMGTQHIAWLHVPPHYALLLGVGSMLNSCCLQQLQHGRVVWPPLVTTMHRARLQHIYSFTYSRVAAVAESCEVCVSDSAQLCTPAG